MLGMSKLATKTVKGYWNGVSVYSKSGIVLDTQNFRTLQRELWVMIEGTPVGYTSGLFHVQVYL